MLTVLAVVGAVNSLFGGWDNARRVSEWGWDWVPTVTESPWFFLAVFIGGIAWLLFIGEPREELPPDYVVHRGVRWRTQNWNRNAVNPYPYCPTHDVKLLWEADDKFKASWALHEVEPGMWFSSVDNGHLWCSSGGGHAIHVPDEDRWMAQQAAMEAASLLEGLVRTAKAPGERVRTKG